MQNRSAVGKDYTGFFNGIFIDWDAFEYAFFIDQELNVIRSGLTVEQAAGKAVPLEWRTRAIAEYKRWL